MAVTALGTAGEHWSYVLRSANGHVQYLADINGGTTNISAFQYDGHDRLWLNYYPKADGSDVNWADSEANAYDANGNVTARRMRDGQMITFSYDALDRVTARNRPNIVHWEVDHVYAYDNLSRLTQATDSVGHSLSFAWDALGRMTSETSNWTGAFVSAYDLAGRRTRLTWPGTGLYVDYDHLVTGEIVAIRENGATSGAGVLGSYAYDDRSRRTSLTRGNGTVTTYTYDAVSRLTELVQDLNGAANDLTLGFGHNPALQIVGNTRSNDAFSFTGHANFNIADTVNGLNQVTQSGSTSIGHDARGNISAIGASSYIYTSDNRLATAPGSDYAYDPVDRLFHESAPWSILLYDGQHMASEVDATTGVVRRRYVFGPGIDEPLVWYEGMASGTRRALRLGPRDRSRPGFPCFARFTTGR